MRFVPEYVPDPDHIDRQLDIELAAIREATERRNESRAPGAHPNPE